MPIIEKTFKIKVKAEFVTNFKIKNFKDNFVKDLEFFDYEVLEIEEIEEKIDGEIPNNTGK